MERNAGVDQESPRASLLGEMAHATLRGAIGATAMTGIRTFTVESGLVEQSPPQAIANQRRAHKLLKRIPRERRVAAIELVHWGYGAVGGTIFGMLPESVRGRLWAGPLYGMLIWVGFEFGIAPLLGLQHAKNLRVGDRLAIASDHLLYGVVLSEMRHRP
jgi:hypothetical protein